MKSIFFIFLLNSLLGLTSPCFAQTTAAQPSDASVAVEAAKQQGVVVVLAGGGAKGFADARYTQGLTQFVWSGPVSRLLALLAPAWVP